MEKGERKLADEVEKEVRDMGYDSCDEEWSPLKWYFLLERVQEREVEKREKREERRIKERAKK